MTKTVFITGGAGFIGSCVVRQWLDARPNWRLVVIDKMTYAAGAEALTSARKNPRFSLIQADIGDAETMASTFAHHQPDAVIHLAAESHVDRSIAHSAAFIDSNIVGSYRLLEVCCGYWSQLPAEQRAAFRFVHVSTDEVYGSADDGQSFTEDDAYAPNSPYAASKAASDHLVRAWHQTYGLPTITGHASNNYGPFQLPEKLIPLMIHNAVAGLPLPLYGDGLHARDWLHVEDHARALLLLLERGEVGASYGIGTGVARSNQTLLAALCAQLDQQHPAGAPHARLIQHVRDRPGHDRRYAINPAKIQAELGWSPQIPFEAGLQQTVQWYLAHPDWLNQRGNAEHQRWLARHYGDGD